VSSGSAVAGARSRPFTWDRTVEKLHWLAEQYADDGLRGAIVDTVGHLDEVPVSALTGLLAKVSPQRRQPQRGRISQ
jgi:2-methylcitrate dehydratase